MEFAESKEQLHEYTFGMVQIAQGSDLIGKTYREANIPQRTHLVVIGYYSLLDELQVNPKAENKIELGDKLLVFGLEQQINDLKVIEAFTQLSIAVDAWRGDDKCFQFRCVLLRIVHHERPPDQRSPSVLLNTCAGAVPSVTENFPVPSNVPTTACGTPASVFESASSCDASTSIR